jgi:hypothetical protein
MRCIGAGSFALLFNAEIIRAVDKVPSVNIENIALVQKNESGVTKAGTGAYLSNSERLGQERDPRLVTVRSVA